MPIACTFYDLTIVGKTHRSKSAVASAAYQSGDKLYSEADEKMKRYPRRIERIQHTEIMLPSHVPRTFLNREKLWNAVEKSERQWNAQFARRFVMALPRELAEEQNLAFVRQYLQEQFVSKGMCVDWAYHYDGDGNPHIHVLTTMRPMDEKGNFLPKSRKIYILDENGQRIRLKSGEWKTKKIFTTDWDNPDNLEKWRAAWGNLQNEYLERAGSTVRIDMRSYERQGVDKIPMVHLGPEASAMEKRGIHTYLGDMNRAIAKRNALIQNIKKGLAVVRDWLEKAHDEMVADKAERNAPTIRSVLLDYVYQRNEHRADWSPSYKTKYFLEDFHRVKELAETMEQKGVYNVSDLTRMLCELEARSKAAGETIRRNTYRRKDIEKIVKAGEIYQTTKPIFDKWSRIHFPGAKAKFEEEHRDELAEHRKAYGRLMKQHGGKLELAPDEFVSELAKMQTEDAAAHMELEAIKDDLDKLRKIRSCVRKVDLELIGEKRSVYKELAAEEKNHRADEQKNGEKKQEQDRY